MKKRKTVKKRYVIALVIVIAGLITLWRILNAPVPTYQTLIVRPGDLQQSVLATGKLDALRKVDVGAQVSGQLKTLSVAIGARNDTDVEIVKGLEAGDEVVIGEAKPGAAQ